MLKLISLMFVVLCVVNCVPQQIRTDDVEVSRDQTFTGVEEAEVDYKFTLEDGHERQQERREIDGAQVVIGFYKYVDPDGKDRQIYYKADKNGYHVNYDKPFEFPGSSDAGSERLSSAYLPPKQNLIKDVLANEYLPPSPLSNQYLPPSY